MKALIFADPHITENSMEELSSIFEEILSNKEDEDILVCLGDWNDKKRPSPKEIKFGTYWAKEFKDNFERFIMIIGNHPDLGELSNVDYLSNLGIECYEEYVLNDYYFGHFMTDLSLKSFGEYKRDRQIKDLLRYKYGFIGHQHDYQRLTDNLIHLGSCRYVSFGELESKKIARVNDGIVSLIGLETPLQAITTYCREDLDSIDANKKVRLIFKDFDTFKRNINSLEQYKKKFKVFKVELDFEEIKSENTIKENSSVNFLIKEWLSNIKDIEVRKELEDEFKKNNIN
jgi:DNA repair exonuclease SbcCD nuclease subunit